MKNKTFCFDLDNTLCTTKKNFYSSARPKKNAIKVVNMLFDRGYTIKIYTARYMGRSKDSIQNKQKIHRKISNQLKKFKIKHHKLFISKPSAEIYVDDKGYGYSNLWIKDFKKFIRKN